ncbi:hypothetical protein [Hansschlegelia zhihuaiae]|uniref:Uncharacterized protein n=1 Tax=Hansschlegelia zhihuaiae TaxID=405005 RepID=A0A4Q0MKD1_9HYPH|nr:hypothetical protein [Hansschlegelia zhihuaiae]RXF73539.1 hypothetical protein EK403_10120 [Hansschlegelia zhihuaiae]
MIEFATGLVPLFRREPVRKAQAVRPPRPPAPEPAPAEVPEPVEVTRPEPPAAARPAASVVDGRALRRHRRSFLADPRPELLSVRMKLADAAFMAEVCLVASCRRARSCRGVGGCVCLADHKARLQPVLALVKARAAEMGPEEMEE